MVISFLYLLFFEIISFQRPFFPNGIGTELAEERGNRPGQLNGPNGSESIDYAAMANCVLPFKVFVPDSHRDRLKR